MLVRFFFTRWKHFFFLALLSTTIISWQCKATSGKLIWPNIFHFDQLFELKKYWEGSYTPSPTKSLHLLFNCSFAAISYSVKISHFSSRPAILCYEIEKKGRMLLLVWNARLSLEDHNGTVFLVRLLNLIQGKKQLQVDISITLTTLKWSSLIT
jgi:hypothetical protein